MPTAGVRASGTGVVVQSLTRAARSADCDAGPHRALFAQCPREERLPVFKTLLIPLDGSALAEQSLGQAAAIARATRAGIDVVTVHQPRARDGYGAAPRDDRSWDDEHRYLETVASELAAGGSIRVSHSMLNGDPEEMISRRAADIEADLIVITSHGRTGFSRTWFGSVADGLVRRGPAPVLILRPIAGDARKSAAHHLFNHILVPLDGSPLAAEILPTAIDLARCSGARITLLGVVQPMLASPYDPTGLLPFSVVLRDETVTTALVEDAIKDLNTLSARLAADGVDSVDAHVVIAENVANGIVEFARSHDVDVVAISTHGRGTSRYFVGSVADKVLRASGLPILLRRSVPAVAAPRSAVSVGAADANSLPSEARR
jgi:nucleotide-binding universal stress UspA family protein